MPWPAATPRGSILVNGPAAVALTTIDVGAGKPPPGLAAEPFTLQPASDPDGVAQPVIEFRRAARIRDGDHQTPAVDAGDCVALFADHEAATVVLFLEAVRPSGEQARQFAFVDGVEQLTADAAVAPFVAGLMVGFGFPCGGGAVLIALDQLRGDELVEELGSGFKRHGRFIFYASGDPQRLQAALGYGPGLEQVSKRLCVSGVITPAQWDAEFARRTVELGMPLLFLQEAVNGPDTAAIPSALEFMMQMLPKAFYEPLEEPAILVPVEWFAHYRKLLGARMRTLPHEFSYVMERMGRQLFPVSLRLTTWAGHWSGASAGECEALALDLCAHALRGMAISVAGLAWHGLGLDMSIDLDCNRKELARVLNYLRRGGPMSKSDLTHYGKVEKEVRDILLEDFVAEDLVRVEGKMVAPTTYEEFAAALYARKEFPEPTNHWKRATGMAGATA